MHATVPDPVHIHNLMMFMMPFFLFGMVLGCALVLVPYWQIFKKAGMTPALSLLMVVPLANIVMLYVLAFSRWNVVPAGPEYPPYPYYPPPPGYPPPMAYGAPPVYPPPSEPASPPPVDPNPAS